MAKQTNRKSSARVRRFLQEYTDESKLNTPKYTPNKATLELIREIQEAYNVGEDNLHKPLRVFSNKSVLEIDEKAHDILHIYKPEIEKEITEAWMSNTKRPISRNKTVVVVAHRVNQLIIPSVKAQAEGGEFDEAAAAAMKDILDYIRNNISYAHTMSRILLESTASPNTYAEVGFRRVLKKVRDGMEVKAALDEYMSGFFMDMHTISQVLVPNINEPDIQKQPWVIIRKPITYTQAKALYGDKENFKYVQPGTYLKVTAKGTAYDDDADDLLNDLGSQSVEYVRYYNRFEDKYVVMLNGVVINTDNYAIPRSDKLVPLATVGYEPITREASFYHYPFILKISEDQKLLEELYNIVIDGAKLDAMPPLAVTQEIDGTNVIPGASTVVNSDFNATPLAGGRNLSAGFAAIAKIEHSFEQVAPEQLSGIKSPGEKTRREVEILSSNADTSQALFTTGIIQFVTDLTRLMIGDATDHIVRAALRKIIHNNIAFDTIIIPESDFKSGAKKTIIRFTSPFADIVDPLERSFALLEEEKRSKAKIKEVNPVAFLDYKFSVYITPEQISAQDPIRKEQIARELYILLKDNPTVELEELTRHLVTTYAPYHAEKLMKNPSALKQMQLQQAPEQEVKAPPRLGGFDNAPVDKPGIPTV